MPRRNIAHLPVPAARFRVDRDTRRDDGVIGFETKAFCRNEDRTRASLLHAAARRFPASLDVRKACALARKLERSGEIGEIIETPASSLYMGSQRRRVIGALWPLIEGDRFNPTTFTIIPRTGEYSPSALEGVNPKAFLAGFRTDLYTHGAAQAGGWLIAFIHGEYDPIADVIRLHLHGAADQRMVSVIDNLRNEARYRAVKTLPDGTPNPVYRRVWVRRKPLVNLPDPLTYLMQSFWPSRPIIILPDGARRRVRQKHRIPEPVHSQILLWLDRWRLADLTLMIGLRVTTDGLIRTQRST